MFFTETLRRYPNGSILNRECTEEYKLPDSDFVIPKGMKIIIPVFAIHHDPEYYPDPYKFDPERFTDDKIPTKNNFTFFPFGEGPRICLGKFDIFLSGKIITQNFLVFIWAYVFGANRRESIFYITFFVKILITCCTK